MLRELLGGTLLLLIAAAPAARAAQNESPPLVFAAASLQEALQAAADAWSASSGTRPVLTFAASSTLARQIEAGAPADLFLSADEQWMDHLAQRGLLRPGTRTTLLGNRLVLIAPRASRVELQLAPGADLRGALDRGRIALADPDSVPAGRYAREALVALGLWSAVADAIAPAENVRAALALVERAETPLGIVYATDARASARVRIVDYVPADAHAQIAYPLAMLARSARPQALGLYRFLCSPDGRAVFARFGFVT